MDFLNNLPMQLKLMSISALPVIGAGSAVLFGSAAGCDMSAAGMLLAGAGAFAGFSLAWWESRRISQFQRAAIEAVNAIANSETGRKIPPIGRDELGHLAYALENLRRGQSRNAVTSVQDTSTTRLLAALDVCDTNVMVADADMRIVYLNKTAIQMFKTAESDLKRDLPTFSADGLVGKNVDEFHANPMHQRRMIEGLKETFSTRISVGGRNFTLLASPIMDGGQRLGTVIEWKDVTQELKKRAEEELQARENSRIRSALDVCDTSVMLADAEMNIIYMNRAVHKMLKNREDTIRQYIPSFDVSRLIGMCVDAFHKNPSHQRHLLKELRDSHTTDVHLGELTFGLIATPIRDDSGEYLGAVIEWEDKTDALAQRAREEQVNRENLRVRQALDSVSGNVMIGDDKHNIVYANRAWFDMMRAAEIDVRKELNGFAVDRVLGSSMDIFHKNPANQRAMVDRLQTTHRAQIVVGGRTFSLIATPINDATGSRVGTVVEWADRTAEVAIEREIDLLVESAGNGDFTRTINLEGKSGFFRKLSEGLNTLMETTEVGVNDVIRVLGAMAKGDLNEKITRDYQGAFGQLKRDANGTVEKLKEIITNIRQSASLISSAANEIAIGNTDLSQRTEEQASSLEETASSMEEMTSTVKQSAENARHANELAGEAQRRARQGGDVVGRAVQAMDEINRSSKKIADIIGVIDEIAFQTNLLALNAAVEAARAGEQGRGFAVVAGEVRNLAQRSAAAAKEIKDLIRDSVNKVTDGAQLVNHSGETLSQIVEAVEKVSTMMREISDAAQEQTSGIEQVNTAVSQMDEMTQQNAALVEEASAAAEAMAEQAQKLSRMMDFFQIESGADNLHMDAVQRRSAHLRVASSGGGYTKSHTQTPVREIRNITSHSNADDEWEEF